MKRMCGAEMRDGTALVNPGNADGHGVLILRNSCMSGNIQEALASKSVELPEGWAELRRNAAVEKTHICYEHGSERHMCWVHLVWFRGIPSEEYDICRRAAGQYVHCRTASSIRDDQAGLTWVEGASLPAGLPTKSVPTFSRAPDTYPLKHDVVAWDVASKSLSLDILDNAQQLVRFLNDYDQFKTSFRGVLIGGNVLAFPQLKSILPDGWDKILLKAGGQHAAPGPWLTYLDYAPYPVIVARINCLYDFPYGSHKLIKAACGQCLPGNDVGKNTFFTVVELDAHYIPYNNFEYTRMPDDNARPEQLDSRILAGIEQINKQLERKNGGSGKADSIVLTDAAVAIEEDNDKWSGSRKFVRDAKRLKTAVKECSNCGKEKKLECFRRRHEGFGGNIVESCLTCEFPFCASCNRRLTEREGPLSKREMRKEVWPYRDPPDPDPPEADPPEPDPPDAQTQTLQTQTLSARPPSPRPSRPSRPRPSGPRPSMHY